MSAVRARKTVSEHSSSDSDDARRRIIEAAAEAFMKNGYGATSINDICVQLGATKGMLYHHFNSKADLFLAVHQLAMDINLGAMRPIAFSARSANDRLESMLAEQIRLAIQYLPFMCAARIGVEMYLLRSTTSKERSVLRKLMTRRREFEQLFLSVIEDGIRRGEFRETDANIVNKSLLSVLNWFTVWYQVERTAPHAQVKMIDNMVAFIMSGIRIQQDADRVRSVC